MTLDYQGIIEEIAIEVQPHFGRGRVATYIPALAAVPPRQFGMAVATVDGGLYTTGDAHTPFTLQSVSKLFALMLALNRYGDVVWTCVGKEPSGDPFNSLVLLEHEQGFPRNPFINAGALVITDLLIQTHPEARTLFRDYVRVLSGNHGLDWDLDVAASELEHSHTNAALAHLMTSHGRIATPVAELLAVYCHQCAMQGTCVDLARLALPLANRGVSPVMDEAVLTERQSKRINAVLLTCGTYDSVGSFAYRVGLPAKSGVSGAIVAVVPGEMSVAVWAPELDRSGNSCVGTAALELFTTLTRKSIF